MIRVNTDSRSSSNVTRNYKWNVKITQIDCSSKREETRNLRGNFESPCPTKYYKDLNNEIKRLIMSYLIYL